MFLKSCVLLLFIDGFACFSNGYYQQPDEYPSPLAASHYNHYYNHHYNHHSSYPTTSTTPRPFVTGDPANALLLVKKEFYVRLEPATFFEAIQYCIDEGKRLASVQSDRDTKALMAIIGESDAKFWLSGTSLGRNGRWIWLNKHEVIGYTNWQTTAPDDFGGTEKCLEFDAAVNGEWNDYNCDNFDFYICEDSNTLLNIIGK